MPPNPPTAHLKPLARIALGFAIAWSVFALLFYPTYHHNRRFTQAWFENHRNPTPESAEKLAVETRKDRRTYFTIQSIWIVLIAGSALALRHLRQRP